MSHIETTDTLFFARADATLDRDAATAFAATALAGMDDGELFLEYRESEALALEDGRIRSAAFDTTLGFGLRAVSGEAVGYAHAGELTEAALKRAVETVREVKGGQGGSMDVAPRATNARLYSDANPVAALDFAAKARLLAEIDAYARGKDQRVAQVMASLTGEWQAVQIIRADGVRAADVRPLVRLNIAVVVEQGGRRETGSYGTGGRFDAARLIAQTRPTMMVLHPGVALSDWRQRAASALAVQRMIEHCRLEAGCPVLVYRPAGFGSELDQAVAAADGEVKIET